MIQGVHHIAIICSDLDRSLEFYCELLGMKVEAKHFRSNRNSWKVDLSLNGIYTIELFTFPDSLQRPSYPEAQGLRHLAFATDQLDELHEKLKNHVEETEDVRIDEFTNKRFFFTQDPDALPIEIYEI